MTYNAIVCFIVILLLLTFATWRSYFWKYRQNNKKAKINTRLEWRHVSRKGLCLNNLRLSRGEICVANFIPPAKVQDRVIIFCQKCDYSLKRLYFKKKVSVWEQHEKTSLPKKLKWPNRQTFKNLNFYS